MSSCVVAALGFGALGAWVAWLGVGARVGVLLVRAFFGVVGWRLPCAGRFVLSGGAWKVVRNSAWMVVWGLACVGGWGWLLGVCVSGVRWIGLGCLAVWQGVMVGSWAWVIGEWFVWPVVWCSVWAAKVRRCGMGVLVVLA